MTNLDGSLVIRVKVGESVNGPCGPGCSTLIGEISDIGRCPITDSNNQYCFDNSYCSACLTGISARQGSIGFGGGL